MGEGAYRSENRILALRIHDPSPSNSAFRAAVKHSVAMDSKQPSRFLHSHHPSHASHQRISLLSTSSTWNSTLKIHSPLNSSYRLTWLRTFKSTQYSTSTSLSLSHPSVQLILPLYIDSPKSSPLVMPPASLHRTAPGHPALLSTIVPSPPMQSPPTRTRATYHRQTQ